MASNKISFHGLCRAWAAVLCLVAPSSALAWDGPQWVRQLGTSGIQTSSNGVATDPDGNVYIAGIVSPVDIPYLADAWLAKYSPTGTLLWNNQIVTSNYDQARAVATDGQGNIYISGEVWLSDQNDVVGQTEVWFSKYSTYGELLWQRQAGYPNSNDYSDALTTDRNGNVYFAGDTEGSPHQTTLSPRG
jgi:Beta-propeller repeat